MQNSSHFLTLSCPDKPGLVARVARILAENGGNIRDSQQLNDAETHSFFMRITFDLANGEDESSLRPSSERRKVLLMASKFDHCLGDLLYRHRIGELAMDVVGIVKDALSISLIGDIPFHHLPVTKETKPQQEGCD